MYPPLCFTMRTRRQPQNRSLARSFVVKNGSKMRAWISCVMRSVSLTASIT